MTGRSRKFVALLSLLVLGGALVAWRTFRAAGREPVPAAAPRAAAPPAASAAPGAGDLALDADVAADPLGALRLEGQVIDEAGAAAPGAAITISTRPPREARSEGDGSFAFDGLLPARYTLIARAGDACAGPLSLRVGASTEPAILVLRGGARVEATVVAATDQAAIPDAVVELRGAQTLSASTDRAGLATLSGVVTGSYTVAASAPGYAASYQPLAVAPGRTLAIRLTLQRGVPVSGRVVDAERRGLAGARVGFERVSDAPWATPDASRDAATTDASGAFRFDAVAVGTFRFLATHDRAAPGTSPAITVDGRRPVEGVEIVLEPGARLAGRVVSRSGAPVAGAVVRVAPQDPGVRARPRQTASDRNGAFDVGGLPRRRVWLVAAGEQATSETLAFDLAERPERDGVVVTLGADGVIAGVVVDDAGASVPGAQVAALPELSADALEASRLRPAATDVADGGGAFRLAGLPDGTYQLHAYRFGVPAAAEWLPDATPARVGDEHVRLLLRAGGAVRGKVLFSDGSAPAVYNVRAGMGPQSPFSASDGAFRLDDLAPGRVTLVVSGPGFETTTVEKVAVEPGGEVDVGTITVARGRIISGHVLTADGKPVAGAQVFAGKRIIGSGDGLTTQVWGPPGGSGATRSDTSDDTGQYVLRGLGPVDLVVVADHAQQGRSPVVRLPASTESATIDLVLEAQGAIQGVVTRGGQPVEGMTVNASPQLLTHASNFVVSTGSDGAYRFDRLTPDRYTVSAMGGMHPIVGVNQIAVAVEVTAGQTAVANIDLPLVTSTLSVAVVEPEGQPVRMAEVHAVGGKLAATTAGQVHDFEAAMSGGFSAFNIVIDGRPAQIKNVPPGPLSVCAVPYPRELAGADGAAVARFIAQYGRALPAVCAEKLVGGEPQLAMSIAAAPPPRPESGSN